MRTVALLLPLFHSNVAKKCIDLDGNCAQCINATDSRRIWNSSCVYLSQPVRTNGGVHTCQPLKWWHENADHYHNVSVCANCSLSCSPAPSPHPSPPRSVNRTTPGWNYNWEIFPAFWFGANASGFENAEQLQLIGKYSLVLFGWQHMQLASNYSDVLASQMEQARRVKRLYPLTPTFVYLPVVDAQPYYASEEPLFTQRQTYANFFYLNRTGDLFPGTTHHKCMGPISSKASETEELWQFVLAADKYLPSHSLTHEQRYTFDPALARTHARRHHAVSVHAMELLQRFCTRIFLRSGYNFAP